MMWMVLFAQLAFSQVPISPEALQLERLIESSQKEVQVLRELLRNAERDSDALEKASRILQSMSAGIEKSLAPYQGKEVYERALLNVQAQNDFARTFSDADRVRKHEPEVTEDWSGGVDFQKTSVQANVNALEQSEKLAKALVDAPPGFVPKLQAQAAVGDWQSGIRISAQVTELLATLKAVREELRRMREQGQSRDPLSAFVNGGDLQNQKQRGGRR